MCIKSKTIKLKYGIWGVVAIWTASDWIWFLTRTSLGHLEVGVGMSITLFVIAMIWWLEMGFFRLAYSEFMVSQARTLNAAFRMLTICFFGLFSLMALGLKISTIFIGYGQGEELPLLVYGFVLPAAAFYFSLLSRSTREKK